tara:strand:- start:100 stop:750 length:651 start_codon:yes stop_codon:yes gene_type:complete
MSNRDTRAWHYKARMTHEHNPKDDFRTPDYLIWYLKKQFGSNLLDAACTEENALGDFVNIFVEDDLIPFDYTNNGWIYINPPFDMKSIVAFVKQSYKWFLNGWRVVLLLPNKLCSKTFVTQLNHHFAGIVLLGGRIDFDSPYATKGGTSMNGCFLAILGDTPTKITNLALSQIKSDFVQNREGLAESEAILCIDKIASESPQNDLFQDNEDWWPRL